MTEPTEKLPAVLVVDDSRLMRVAARKILKTDFEIVEAEDGEIAWDTLQENHDIDLVMSDLSMPNLDGLGLLKKIRQSGDIRLKDLPVIIVTGAEDDNGSKESALAAGASDFITKPFESVQLLARAKTHAKQQRTQQALKHSEKHSNTDNLTGLVNAKDFEQRLDGAISYCVRHTTGLSLVLVKVDKYKVLFLRRGKKTAEAILCQLGEYLSRDRRCEDIIARIGMDTFALLLPSATRDGALRVAEQLLADFKAQTFSVDDAVVPFTLSLAVQDPGSRTDISSAELLKMAHEQLAQAQQAGGDQVFRLSESPAASEAEITHSNPVVQAPVTAGAGDVHRALLAIADGKRPDACMDELVRAVLPMLESWAATESTSRKAVIDTLANMLDSGDHRENAATETASGV